MKKGSIIIFAAFVLIFTACNSKILSRASNDNAQLDDDMIIDVDNQSEDDDRIDNDIAITDDDAVITDDVFQPDSDAEPNQCYTNSTCLPDEYCSKSLGTCDENAVGRCELRQTLQDCKDISAVINICGCDGYSYSHPCWAAYAGTIISKEKKCDGDILCLDNTGCEGDEFCRKIPGVCDMPGVCRPKPSECSEPVEGEAVCGCNANTYSSECLANASGNSVDYTGGCL